MYLQKGTDQIDCMLAAAAMVMDIPLAELKERIHHDAFEKIFPNAPEPMCYRGYHIQEIIDQAFLNGWHVMEIQTKPSLVCFADGNKDSEFFIPINDNRIKVYLGNFSGIIGGILPGITAHAVAWDHKEKKIYDPCGEVYKL
ncbi:MAG: hypothetical protein ACFFG0_15610, partial [Candidatus Thorarchaeota archaeon]